MGMLVRLLVVVGIVLVLYKILLVPADNVSAKNPPAKETQRVKDELDKSLDQYQEKLNNALKQSGSAE